MLFYEATSPDLVIMALNKILALLFEWCCRSLLTPHPGKTEFMLLSRSRFVGPLPGLKFGNCYIEQVTSSRCLGVEVDHEIKWNVHVSELIKSFSQKLSLLTSLYFLPIEARLDFYFKVILLSVTYGLLIWGSCGKTLFSSLERIHVRAAKIISIALTRICLLRTSLHAPTGSHSRIST